MHPNKHFRHGDRSFHDKLIDQVGFGMIFAQTPDGPRVAHTPLIAGRDGTIRFHLARGNALVKHLPDSRALVVVNGPDTYISARWYSDPNQVSTWNYVSIELEGQARAVEPDELIDILNAITARHEARIKHGTPWTMDKLTDKHREGLLRAIVGFELKIEEWRETVKLAQHKLPEVRQQLIDGLDAEGGGQIADLMRELPR